MANTHMPMRYNLKHVVKGKNLMSLEVKDK